MKQNTHMLINKVGAMVTKRAGKLPNVLYRVKTFAMIVEREAIKAVNTPIFIIGFMASARYCVYIVWPS